MYLAEVSPPSEANQYRGWPGTKGLEDGTFPGQMEIEKPHAAGNRGCDGRAVGSVMRCAYPECKRERNMIYLGKPLCGYHFDNINRENLQKKLVVRRERDEKERGGS